MGWDGMGWDGMGFWYTLEIVPMSKELVFAYHDGFPPNPVGVAMLLHTDVLFVC